MGTLSGGASSTAFDINDQGKVVGISQTASGDFHAFVWTSAQGMSDLGTFPGGLDSRAGGVNAFGRVVGRARTAAGNDHAFEQLGGGALNDLGTLGGANSSATDLNNFGQVVGASETALGESHATLRALQPPPPQTQLQRLADEVQAFAENGSLVQGAANSLTAKLEASSQMAENGNTIAAVNQLRAFINSLQAIVRSGRLTEAQAMSLIVGAERLIEQLGG